MLHMSSERRLSEKQPDSSDFQTRLSALEEKLDKVDRRSKGYSGKIGRIESRIGLKDGGTSAPLEDSSANQATTEPKQAESSGSQADPKHFGRRYEEWCPDCGGKPAEYVKPNVFCNSPKCKGVIPLGTVTKEDVKNGQIEKIQGCWNCSSHGEDLHVVIRE